MIDDLPSLNGWFNHCVPSLSNNVLKILFTHPVAYDLFKLKILMNILKNGYPKYLTVK